MIKAKHASYETRTNPLPPRGAPRRDTVVPQPLGKDNRFHTVGAIQEVEEEGLGPAEELGGCLGEASGGGE